VFSDDFNRANGAVGNGWTSYGGGATIVNDELQTLGEPAYGGGVYRTLSVTFPLTFSFDFSTADPSVGGWFIAFNAISTLVPGPQPGQVSYFQFEGSGGIQTVTPTGFESSPDLPENFGAAFGQVYGQVNADLSAVITVTYADGTQVSVTFGPQASGPIGSMLVLGNSDASGTDYFDNLQINEVPEPATGLLLLAPLAALVLRRRK
jgi:hypothetical protein